MNAFAFRPLKRSDFPLLSHWLEQPHVARWWADDSAPESLEAQYGGNVDGGDPAEVRIACAAGRPVGLVQRYAIAAYPDHQASLRGAMELPPGAWSIDYLIGEAADTNRGTGTALVGGWVDATWREQPQARCIVVPVHAANLASRRVLERNGFTLFAECHLEPDNPSDTREHAIYRLDRSASSASRNMRTSAGTSLRPGSSA